MKLTKTIKGQALIRLLFLFSVLLYIPFLSTLQAGTCTWNSVYGNWSDPANWSPVGLPAAGDDIVITTGKVLIDIEVTAGTLTMSGGTIDGTENLTVTGDFDWSGGTVSATAAGPSLIVNGNLAINGSSDKTLTFRTMEVRNTGSWTAGNVNIGSNTTFQVASGASFEFALSADATFGSTASGIVDIQGTLTKSQASTANFNGFLNSNGGSININEGILNGAFASSGNHTGLITIAKNATFQFSGGNHDFNSGSSVSGDGKISVAGATVSFNVSNASTPDIDISSGTFNDNAAITVGNINHSSGTFSGTGATQVNGLYTWNGGTISGDGSTTADSMFLDGSSKTLTHRTFSLTGHGDWEDGHIRISSSGTFQVSGGSVFNINHSGNHDFGSASDGVIDVSGTINKITSSRTSIKCEFRTSSGAIVNVSNGVLRNFTSSSGAHEGTINISSGATFQNYRGTHLFNSGSSVTGDGLFSVTNDGIVTFNSGSGLTSNVEVTRGTLTDDAGFSPSSFTLSGGTFSGTGIGNCTGNMSWSGGTISGSNTFSVAGSTSFSGTSLALSEKTLQINGTGDWQSADFAFSNDGILKVGVGGDLQLNHSVVQSISGTGTLVVEGTLSKRLNSVATNIDADASITGSVIGIGTINFGTIINQGTFSPGISSISELTTNKFDNTNGAIDIEINSTGTGGIDFDLLTLSSGATLGGTLNVSLLNGFVPTVGNEFTILTSSTSVNGNFNTQNLPVLPSDRQWVTQYNPTNVTLQVAALLPVELKHFDALVQDEKVSLKWSTASEKNNRGFDVQRSYDGVHWRSIDFVDGYGYSNTERNYQTQDYPSLEGTIYYRLRQVDWKGDFELSPVRSVEIKNGKGLGFFEVSPNPVHNDKINVVFQESLAQIAFYEIRDLKGSLVKKGALEPGIDKYQISFRTPVKGFYNLSIQSGSNNHTFKILMK